MNKNIIKISTLLATSLWASQLLAGSVTIPNTFESGTAASASEVNANFTAVESAVNDNDGRITNDTSNILTNTTNISTNTEAISSAVPQVVLKAANGEYVGRVIGMSHSSMPYVLTDKGYRTKILLGSGQVQEYPDGAYDGVYYESTDCQGDAYVSYTHQRDAFRSVGTVFVPMIDSEAAYNAGLVLYTPSDEPSVVITANSEFNWFESNITCTTLASTTSITGHRALPNVPNITGIQNTAYEGMIIE